MNVVADLFRELNYAVLSQFAEQWAKRYGIIEKVSLHHCVSPRKFGMPNLKYVVIFHYAQDTEILKL